MSTEIHKDKNRWKYIHICIYIYTFYIYIYMYTNRYYRYVYIHIYERWSGRSLNKSAVSLKLAPLPFWAYLRSSLVGPSLVGALVLLARLALLACPCWSALFGPLLLASSPLARLYVLAIVAVLGPSTLARRCCSWTCWPYCLFLPTLADTPLCCLPCQPSWHRRCWLTPSPVRFGLGF